MIYILIGITGFLVFHLMDIAAIKKIALMKPVVWAAGCSLLLYATVMACISPEKMSLPLPAVIAGWVGLPLALILLVYSLFINLPFRKTYVKKGVGDELITTGLYAFVRHPGVYPLVISMLALAVISRSSLMLQASIIWTAVDIVVIWIQDRSFFPRMYPGYAEYRRQTPMLIPGWYRLRAMFMSNKTYPSTAKEENSMSQLAEMFKQGQYDAVWQRCCGFIDLSLEECMHIQKRLLLEQLEMFKKCDLGKYILNGANPETLDDFREMVPLTTYEDYAPYLLKRRMDVLPRKPLLWQYTSGKSGEYEYRWVPVTARTVDEIEPMVFALMFFSSCKQRGEINMHKGDRVLYGMAPPPYATGTITRVFPYQLFSVLPPVEQAEQEEFEERIQKGFEMGLSQGMDCCIAMSSVAVAIGQRFSRQGGGHTDIKALLKKNPAGVMRLARGMLKARMAGRPLMPKDLWHIKSMITFGIDNAVFREKIKDMWGRYSLDFHGCTEALIIAMQTWDYDTMTFVPHLNFFEFIPEEDAIKSRADKNFKPRVLLMNELVPGNYELVISSFHGGPFMRYRLGHLIKIHSMRNEKLNIDIPQMSFISRIDDQIDIAGFTRLGEKVIWQALENSGLPYQDWVACKETRDKPVLHLYVELKQEGRNTPVRVVTQKIHEELKKLDKPYEELESFTGIHPLKITLLPEGAFETYKLRLKAAGGKADAGVTHINPPAETVDFLVNTAAVVKVHKTSSVQV